MKSNVQFVFVLLLYRHTFTNAILVQEQDHLLLMKLSQDMEEMKLKQDELIRENAALKTIVNGTAVGFTAKFSKMSADLMLFSNVVTNVGGGYHPTNGTFICRVPGLYLFHVSVVTSTPGHADIMKNGQRVVRAYSGANADDSDGHWDGDTATAVLYLNTGNQVFVTNTGLTVDGDSDFSGVLITPM